MATVKFENIYKSFGETEVLFDINLEIDDKEFLDQMNRDAWPKLKLKMAKVIKLKSRDEWTKIFDSSDACVSPVLSLSETPSHTHHLSRNTFMDVNGFDEPAPAPRFSNSKAENKSILLTSGSRNDDVSQLYDLDIAIGIKSTSVGIGKNIDSMKLKKPRTFLDFNNRSFCIK